MVIFSWARPMNSTCSVPSLRARYSCSTPSLRCPLPKSTSGTRCSAAKRLIASTNALLRGAITAVEGISKPQVPGQEPHHLPDPLQLRHVQVQVEPVDRLDLEQHMTSQDLSSRAG